VNADLIALQELPADGDLPERLAEGLGGLHVARQAFRRPDDGWTETLAVLCRFAIGEAGGVELRADTLNCLHARVETPAGPLEVYDCHLHPRDAGVRLGEARTLRDHIRGRPGAAIVCGDFNAVASGQTLAALAGFRSAYELANGVQARSTFPTPLRREPFGRASMERREAGAVEAPGAAIDYVLVRPEEFVASEAWVFGDRPSADGLWPSDHYAVFARLRRGD
jgi:endonuclease/exonuclease/phosphatase family metal-dependent hydrolase